MQEQHAIVRNQTSSIGFGFGFGFGFGLSAISP